MAKISVALCTYNGARFLNEQLRSIVEQTHPVDEIVISDDGSTDSTMNLLHEWQSRYPDRIFVHQNPVNLKSNANFEQTLQRCTGDFLFLADQDDAWHPEKVQRFMETFAQYPETEALFSDGSFMDDEGNPLHEPLSLWESVRFFPENPHNPDALLHSLLFNANFLTGATLCLRKESLKHSLPFRTGKGFLHDEWLAFVFSQRQTLRAIPERLIRYRLHGQQQVGVSKINDPVQVRQEKWDYQQLVLGQREPHTLNDYKTKAKTYFNQYEKYLFLYRAHTLEAFQSVSDTLKNHYIQADQAMKRKNILAYTVLKLVDRLKGKRQLHH